MYGHDTEDPEADGEFGTCGVAGSSLADMEVFLAGLRLAGDHRRGERGGIGKRRAHPVHFHGWPDAGMLREDAYRVVQQLAMEAWDNESDFRAAVEAHPEITALVPKEKLTETFSVERQLKHVDAIFARVFLVAAPALSENT